MAVKAPEKNKTEMEYGDLVYCMERMLGMFYIRANLRTIMERYGGENGDRDMLINDMNELMIHGQKSGVWEYWEGTQTILDHMFTGRNLYNTFEN